MPSLHATRFLPTFHGDTLSVDVIALRIQSHMVGLRNKSLVPQVEPDEHDK